MFRRFILLAALAWPVAAPADTWFLHEFGELRAYHGDYLSVCSNAGDGPCRTVQTGLRPEGFLFDERLVWHRAPDAGGWILEIMARGMPDALETVEIEIDGARRTLPSGSFETGGYDLANVAETFTVTDPEVNADLLAAMRAGNRMTVFWSPPGASEGSRQFSLRGVTAATNAIAARGM